MRTGSNLCDKQVRLYINDLYTLLVSFIRRALCTSAFCFGAPFVSYLVYWISAKKKCVLLFSYYSRCQMKKVTKNSTGTWYTLVNRRVAALFIIAQYKSGRRHVAAAPPLSSVCFSYHEVYSSMDSLLRSPQGTTLAYLNVSEDRPGLRQYYSYTVSSCGCWISRETSRDVLLLLIPSRGVPWLLNPPQKIPCLINPAPRCSRGCFVSSKICRGVPRVMGPVLWCPVGA